MEIDIYLYVLKKKEQIFFLLLNKEIFLLLLWSAGDKGRGFFLFTKKKDILSNFK